MLTSAQVSTGCPTPGQPRSAAVVAGAERRFRQVQPDWSLPGTGLVAAVTPTADTWWADGTLARGRRTIMVWVDGRTQPELQALLILEQPGVLAVSLALPPTDAAEVQVAIEVAAHLTVSRSRPFDTSCPHLTSATPPAAPRGWVRIPHLVTVVSAAGAGQVITDAAIWELTVRAAAETRLGVPLPDQDLVERLLPHLLALRDAHRTGTLADAAARRLAAALHGRPLPLSIELVYRHLDLFTELLTESTADPVVAAGIPGAASLGGHGPLFLYPRLEVVATGSP